VLGFALTLERQLVSQQLRQCILGRLPLETAFAIDRQFATRAIEKSLAQAIGRARLLEIDIDGRPRLRHAPRRQIRHHLGFEAFEKRGAQRCCNRALAGLIRAHENIEAIGKPVEHQRRAKLPEFFQCQTRDLHAGLPAARVASCWNCTNRRRASRAVSPFAGSPSACIACKALATSAT